MSNDNSERVLQKWSLSEKAEQQALMEEFLKLHNESYTETDFLKFLEEKFPHRFPDTLPISTRSHEH